MKYFLLVVISLIIYVFTRPPETIKIYAKNPPSKVETVYIDNRIPTPTPETNIGFASWYDRSACSSRIYGSTCKTANGEIFDEAKFTTACSSLFKLGDNIELCRLDNCIKVICNDRGNFESLGRDFDLTPVAFGSLANLDSGVIHVRWSLIK
jgi:rare lipoprotein A (peptidoglycan hydrolase)